MHRGSSPQLFAPVITIAQRERHDWDDDGPGLAGWGARGRGRDLLLGKSALSLLPWAGETPHKIVNTINGACLIGGPVFRRAHDRGNGGVSALRDPRPPLVTDAVAVGVSVRPRLRARRRTRGGCGPVRPKLNRQILAKQQNFVQGLIRERNGMATAEDHIRIDRLPADGKTHNRADREAVVEAYVKLVDCVGSIDLRRPPSGPASRK